MLLDSLEVALELEDAMEADVVVLRSVEMLLEIVSVAEPVSGVLTKLVEAVEGGEAVRDDTGGVTDVVSADEDSAEMIEVMILVPFVGRAGEDDALEAEDLSIATGAVGPTD